MTARDRDRMEGRIATGSQWLRLITGLVLVFALFHGSAAAFGSNLGQAGVPIAALVLAALLVAERALFGTPVSGVARSLGLGPPDARGMVAAGGVTLLLFLVVAGYGGATGTTLALLPGWSSLLAGLFAQAGIAEEALFRGYLFGRLRAGRSFLRAAMAATAPFVAVHLLLFFTMPWPIALAAVLLSVVLSFPLAHLFELGGSTIWAPALLHFVVQGTVKVVVVTNDGGVSFPIVWMAASAALPLLVLFVRPSGPRTQVAP